ncbi:MAG: ribbon-helix-helix domain-containing protein [Treponema sp.]|nr:ribbon-helix-helix domain-containing protein [Treponema sp.]
MKRTQIQLPDRLFERLKARAEDEESTLTELMRKAGEYYLTVHPEGRPLARPWVPPAPHPLGAFIATEDKWREMGNSGEAAS